MATVEQAPATVRADGREKVTGSGRYTADLTLTGQLHAAFRYADHPHARITRIDATKARAAPGVLAVVTHEDVPDVLYGGMVKDRRLFARDTVRSTPEGHQARRATFSMVWISVSVSGSRS